jgi:hypothetical protein
MSAGPFQYRGAAAGLSEPLIRKVIFSFYDKVGRDRAIFRLDAVRIELDRQGQRAIDSPNTALAPMNAALRVICGLLAGYVDGVFFGLDLQIFLIESRQFDDRQDVVALLQDVDGREWTRASPTCCTRSCHVLSVHRSSPATQAAACG